MLIVRVGERTEWYLPFNVCNKQWRIWDVVLERRGDVRWNAEGARIEASKGAREGGV